MIYGAMLAGGSGTRVKSSKIPKQFIEIGGKPIIIYTLENMLKVKRFDYIYIAVHKDYEDYYGFEGVKIRPEVPVCCQELYAVLDKCIQEIQTNKDVDLDALIKKSVGDWQSNHLDNIKQ